MHSREYLRALDFPLRFDSAGDLAATTNSKAIEANIRNAIMTVIGGIPLSTEIGSPVSRMPFDDIQTVASLIGRRAAEAVARVEPRAELDAQPLVSRYPDGSVAVIFAYRIIAADADWKGLSIPVALDNR